MTGKVVPYERWIERYGELVRAEMGPELWDGAGDVDLPTERSYWEDYLIDSLGGAAASGGPSDSVENPEIPLMVAEVAAEQESARALLRNLFGALFDDGARAYAGAATGEWDREVLAPHFVVVIMGRRVAYEGEWRLQELVMDGPGEEGLRALHQRLATSVAEWDARP